MSMRIGALWLKESKEGKKYMSGIIEYPGMNMPFAVFKNEDKKSENQPDYYISWSPAKESENKTTNGSGSSNGAPF